MHNLNMNEESINYASTKNNENMNYGYIHDTSHTDNNHIHHNVVIIGAGWAGLSAAFHLAKAGIKSTILEASPQAGGRARGINFGAFTVDNGQHLLIGAYHQTLSILESLNIKLDKIFHKTNFNITTIGDKKIFSIKLPTIFYPLNIITGILLAKGCSIKEKFSLIKFCYYLKKLQPNFQEDIEDISIKDFLQLNNQSANLIKHFWEPIALASLSTPIDIASAKVFVTMMRQIFKNGKNSNNQKNTDFLFTKTDLSNILPKPILKQYQDHINIVYNCRVQSISQDHANANANDDFDAKLEKIFTIHSNKGIINATKIIIATQAHTTNNILTKSIFTKTDYLDANHLGIDHLDNSSASNTTHCASDENNSSDSNNLDKMQTIIKNLNKFNHETIITIYYELDLHLNAKEFQFPMYGLVDTTSNWVFIRAIAKQHNILSVVITANKKIETLTNEQLASKVFLEVKNSHEQFNHVNCTTYKVVKEKKAAFSCTVGVSAIRPAQKSPIKNLYFAGDYTNTGLPATLESAIISGLNCSNYITGVCSDVS